MIIELTILFFNDLWIMRNKNNISGFRYRVAFVRNSMIKTKFYLVLLVQE